MKIAKIYFEGNLITTIVFSRILYTDINELRDGNGDLLAIVPKTHLIVIEENSTITVKGSDLVIPKMPNDRIG